MMLAALLTLCFGVFWPVSIWYLERLFDKSDEPLGVISLIAFIAIAITRANKVAQDSSFKIPVLSIACIIVYAVTWPFVPKLLSAVIAVLAIGFLMSSKGGKFKMDVGSWLLLLFSLPIVSSLNFYSGYPLRLVVGKIAAPLISMAGFPTIADGTALIWNSQVIQIDAPCSGIKMLWFALFVGAVLSSFLDLSVFRSAVVLGCSVIGALLGNVLRVTSLFFIETEVLKIDPGIEQFVHQAVGAVAFAISAGLTVAVAMRFAKQASSRHGDDKAADSSEPNNFGESNLPAFAVPARYDGPEGAQPKDTNKQAPGLMTLLDRHMAAFLLVAVLAAVAPVAFKRADSAVVSYNKFSGWPLKNYDGEPLKAVPANEADAAFYQEFPGKIQCFSQGERRVIMRWVARPTRQLHPSSDCFRGLGYNITWKPLTTDKQGVQHSCYTAEKDGKGVSIRERIYDDAGGNWTDISSWYWAALLGKTKGPWWSVVQIEPVQTQQN